MDWVDDLFEDTAPQDELSLCMRELGEARKKGDALATAEALAAIGHQYRLRDRYGESIRYLSKSLCLYEHLHVVDAIAWVLREQGQVLIALRDFDKAETRIRRALATAEEAENLYEQAFDMLELGTIARWRKTYDESILLLQRALALAMQADSHLLEAYCVHGLGIVEHHRGNHLIADARMREALPIYQLAKDQQGFANCLGDLGCVAIDLKQWQNARNFLGDSIAYDKAHGNKYNVAIGYFNLSRMLLKMNNQESARHFANEARNLLGALDMPLPDFGRDILQELHILNSDKE